MFVECIHQMCCSKWSNKMGSGWWVEFKYPIMLWIKVLWWKWSSSLSPIQPRLCGWAHLHDACICLLSKLYSSQTKPPLHLYPAEPPGVLLQAFPRALWQLLYSNSPCLRMILLKINPLQNCPAHAIIHRGYGVFFFPFALKMISNFVTSHQRAKWMEGGWEKKNLGVWKKLLDLTKHLLIFTPHKLETWDRAFMLRCSQDRQSVTCRWGEWG